MKKALVTGADGFIGSHLTEYLLEKGYKVRALSYYNSFNNWGWLEELNSEKNLEIITGDVRDPFLCKQLVKDVDTIFHLAALIAIPYSYIAPQSYLATNVYGTLNLCEAAKDSGNIRFIITSTSEVYGTAQYAPINEDHPKQPQSPYSASKIAADMVALSYFHSFGLPVTVARPFNTYGPRQSARAVIPSMIMQILSGSKEIKVGDLSPTRDFNFVQDTVQGIWAISENEVTIGREVNICSNSEYSIGEILTKILETVNSNILIKQDQRRLRPENSEVYRLIGDNSLIRNITDWEPKTSIDIGLRKTIEWFQQIDLSKHYKKEIYNI
jgi:NAD dependent epimerase/dehydratase